MDIFFKYIFMYIVINAVWTVNNLLYLVNNLLSSFKDCHCAIYLCYTMGTRMIQMIRIFTEFHIGWQYQK
jgi:hypothetical protein